LAKDGFGNGRLKLAREKVSFSAANRRMFNAVARRYDLLNRIMSFGLDVKWRNRMVEEMRIPPGGQVLDLATGTADVALSILKRCPAARVMGVDASEGMLLLGMEKVRKAELEDKITLMVADAMHLNFTSDCFDAAGCAFGIRNVADRPGVLRELIRVVKPGGRVVIMEPSRPTGRIFGFLFGVYFRKIVPLIGSILSVGSAYRYLVDSVGNFPEPPEFMAEMERAGFEEVNSISLTGGAAVLYIGAVPRNAA